jgi:hypothetical protein
MLLFNGNDEILIFFTVYMMRFLPTMKVQLSQLPKIVGFGARRFKGRALFSCALNSSGIKPL